MSLALWLLGRLSLAQGPTILDDESSSLPDCMMSIRSRQNLPFKTAQANDREVPTSIGPCNSSGQSYASINNRRVCYLYCAVLQPSDCGITASCPANPNNSVALRPAPVGLEGVRRG